mgnify:CR=1 FL=1
MRFLIGKINSSKTHTTSYGSCTNLHISIYASNEKALWGEVKVVCWGNQSNEAEKLNKKQLVMVEFGNYGKETYKGKEKLKVTARRITKSSKRELSIYQKDAEGLHDPFGFGR